jgi:hypothetical protein
MEDLVGMAEIVDRNLTDTNEFTAFLLTGKGTHYAMTINDKAHFLEFFKYKLNEDNMPTEFQALKKWLDSKDEFTDMYDKYFENEDAVIKTNNNDSNQVLEAFLKFLKESAMGVTMFKTDASFNNFTRVSYDENMPSTNNLKIKEQACND